MNTQLALPVTISEIVDSYKEAVQKINQAYDLLANAEQVLDGIVGTSFHYHLPTIKDDRKRGEILAGVQKGIWGYLIDFVGVKKLLSIKRAEELDRNLASGNLPPIEVTAVYETLAALVDNQGEFVREAAVEVFEMLRPNAHHADAYKTNQANGTWEVGKRLILRWMVEPKWGRAGYRVNYNREQDLSALDKVFYALDGKGLNEGYKSPLIDAINTCGADGRGETEYFRFWCYQNGNLHVEFKRSDLVQRLNSIGGGLSGKALKGRK